MEASVIQDEQFMRWITSAAAERYWIYDGKRTANAAEGRMGESTGRV